MLASLIFVAAITAANLSIAEFGPWVAPINAFLLIGLDLALRDYLHDKWHGNFFRMLMLIVMAGVVSLAVNPAASHIAIASAVAFLLASVADWVTYHELRRKPYLIRSNASNTVGAGVDSLIFPTVAFGAIMPEVVATMFFAKVAGGAVWSFLLRRLFA